MLRSLLECEEGRWSVSVLCNNTALSEEYTEVGGAVLIGISRTRTQEREHKAPVAAVQPLQVCQLTAAAFIHPNLRHGVMRMASFMFQTLTLFIICMALQESCGLPLSDRAELLAQAQSQHRVRTKRCSCNSWDDKECIYFCHLDIIWVNTPSKLLPYGLGSPPSRRRRRSAERCECHDPADKTCSGFCHKSSENPRTNAMGPLVKSANSHKLLDLFRSVVKSNTAMAKEVKKSSKPAGVNRPRNRTRR